MIFAFNTTHITFCTYSKPSVNISMPSLSALVLVSYPGGPTKTMCHQSAAALNATDMQPERH
jgi:hypothetical protein